MALTWPRLLTILNSGTLFLSLALVGISPAVLYFTIHGMKLMDKSWPQGYYTWYRGPWNDQNTKHQVRLTYEYSNDNMIIAATVVSALAGLIGFVGFFLAGKPSKPTAQKPTLFLQVVPGTMSFIVTFIAFIYTQVVYSTDNRDKCDWGQGYIPWNQFRCTREQASCKIVGLFAMESWEMARAYDLIRSICHETQTARHLVIPLFVASVLFCGLAVGKYFVEKRENKFVESADERVERLVREE